MFLDGQMKMDLYSAVPKILNIEDGAQGKASLVTGSLDDTYY